MPDFFEARERSVKKDDIEIFGKLKINHNTKDLMIQGGDFLAVWDEENGEWTRSEGRLVDIYDKELRNYYEKNKHRYAVPPKILYMEDADSGAIDRWHKYCQKQMRDVGHPLDEVVTYLDEEIGKEDYRSKRLGYSLKEGSIDAYDEMMRTWYEPSERRKLEWAIGSIVCGDSRYIQKFIVLYGPPKSGKSSFIEILMMLFAGYYAIFESQVIGSNSSSFPLEMFSSDPILAIDHDGDLSRLETNTRFNSIVSHEEMVINEKFKKPYAKRINAMLFVGTNKPVKITDAKSGLLRRLIDVSPTGDKIPKKRYDQLMGQVKFELGAIAYHCKQVYLENKHLYDSYVPTAMISSTNSFYNFVLEQYEEYEESDGVSLKSAWVAYDKYCKDAKLSWQLDYIRFQDELKNYFKKFEERHTFPDGRRIRSYYSGFLKEKFDYQTFDAKAETAVEPETPIDILGLKDQPSVLDDILKDCPAQYGVVDENGKAKPATSWDNVLSKLKDIDTSKVHYLLLGNKSHIVVDLDIKDEKGNKSLALNLEEALKWPKTYTEVSQGGNGLHLHYIYDGNPEELMSRIPGTDIEIKVYTGLSSLRRRRSLCNTDPIATIAGGYLPKKEKKGDKNVLPKYVISDAMHLENKIKDLMSKAKQTRNGKGELHSVEVISLISKTLDEAYDSGISYDITPLRTKIQKIALRASNSKKECLRMVNKMKFKSEDQPESIDISEELDSGGDAGEKTKEKPILFYDVEVFPNLFVVCIKRPGVRPLKMINPSKEVIEGLIDEFRLVGFNNRRYDNHILWGRLMGLSNYDLYLLSKRIINGSKNAFYGPAYNISYTDIYDFTTKKQSLKKYEIELGIHHQELGLPWDEPVPEELWDKVADYCLNDVLATEAVWDARQADFVARQIQVDIIKLLHGINASVNDTTNKLSEKIVFGGNKNPQSEFNWRDLSKPVGSDRYFEYRKKFGEDYEFHIFDADGLPIFRLYSGEDLPEGWSILPFFPKYEFYNGKSYWKKDKNLKMKDILEHLVPKGEDPVDYPGYYQEDVDYVVIGEGGRVYAQPGIHVNVWDGDVSSQHPHSAIYEVVFGPKFTKIFEEIVLARVAVKHKDFETAGKLLNGALKPYLNDAQAADLAQALKIVINSIYGLTSASFVNAFRDPNNIDNIVAKRGALFMTLLMEEVVKRGYTVAHIKTDSIKIPDATQEIQDFVCKFGLEYGYSFETEAEFEKFCLCNDAVYVAKYKEPQYNKKTGQNDIYWTATGKQFKVPYVNKKLLTGEPITFDDVCVTFASSTALYLDFNEGLPEDQHGYRFVGKVGQFTPIMDNCGGAELLREKEGKYSYTAGSKGYKWLESETIKGTDKVKDINYKYFDILVDDAIKEISKFGDVNWFLDIDEWGSGRAPLSNFMNLPEDVDEVIPF